ncbi:MAG TPA: nitrilase-related carbon-nitrogen hydrolase [Caldimonas sp.]
MKIAAVQMVSTPSVERNLEAARRLMGSAAAAGAALVVLPEYFCLWAEATATSSPSPSARARDRSRPCSPLWRRSSASG